MELKKLKKGKIYLVKAYRGIHEHNPGPFTRRVFKGEEFRFENILCYVFSTKIDKGISVTLEVKTEPDNSITNIWHWHWTTRSSRRLNIPNEVSIPYYCLSDVKEVTV